MCRSALRCCCIIFARFRLVHSELFRCENDSLIEAIAKHCPNVTKLKLNSTLGVSFALLSMFQNINSLELRYLSFAARDQLTNYDFVLLKVQNLKILWSNLAFDDMLFLLEKCPNVTQLMLYFTIPTEPTVAAISKLTKLVSLNIGGPYIDDAALMTIVHNCTNIVNIDLSNCRGVTDEGVKTVATKLKQKLKTITLPCSKAITDKSLEYLSLYNGLEALHIIHSIGYGGSTNNLTLPALNSLLQRTQLKCQYTWRTCINKHNCGLDDCANVTTIIVTFYELTDALLFEISQKCMALEYLTLHEQDYKSLTSAAFYAIINNCSKLRSITVRGKMNGTDLREVLASHGKYFRMLE